MRILMCTLTALALAFPQCTDKKRQDKGNGTPVQRLLIPKWDHPHNAGPYFLTLKKEKEPTRKTQPEKHSIRVREPVMPLCIASGSADATIPVEKDRQISEPSRYETAREIMLAASLDPGSYLSIDFQNDAFLSTDKYFTNGIQFAYISPMLSNSLFSNITIPYRKKSVNYFGVNMVQNMYTPTRLDTTIVLNTDRPFASYLYLGFFKQTFDRSKMLRIRSELDLGALGPTSLGGFLQKTIHNTEPTGWVNQINDDILINYTAEIEKGLIAGEHFQLSGMAGGKLGSLYDQAYVSARFITGVFNPYFEGLGFPGKRSRNKERWQAFLHLDARGTAVLYDATLQGGLFSNGNIYTVSGKDIRRITFTGSAGFKVRYQGFELSADLHYITPEFKAGKDHKWVHLKTTICF
ncbi:MAG: lipid A deacylase LpxR family protein [Bacteroidales bacterium]